MRLMPQCATAMLMLLCVSCAGGRESGPVSFDDYALETALSTCRQRTEEFFRGYRETPSMSYFELCMAEHGFERRAYADRWIIFH